MVRKQSVFKILLFLILIMLLVNAYTLFLFIRGVSEGEGLGDFYEELNGVQDDSIRYNQSVPSIRYQVAGRDLLILVPSDLPIQQMTKIAQRIRKKFLEMKEKSSLGGKGQLQSVSRLKRILKKSAFMTKGERMEEAEVIWKGIQGWPFSDSLRLINLGEVLSLANHAPILKAKNSRQGTQLKVEVTLDGGHVALFKPEWYERGIRLNGTAYAGKDRHFGEIAAFYLNLILGYNTGPVIVGRRVQIQREILPVATSDFTDTVFKAHNGSLCFYGTCYFCRKDDPVCGKGEEIEGALILFLDREFKTLSNPWRRTYKVGTAASWETAPDFCQMVMKSRPPHKRLESLLDIVAVSIFDFLIGNGDRHHFEMFRKAEANSNSHSNNIILIDNGKSFGNSEEDYIDILAPLFQCCKIRSSLLGSLKKFEGVLGKSVDWLSGVDPLHPLLSPSHLRALDRRLTLVLATVQVCLDNQERSHSPKKVIC